MANVKDLISVQAETAKQTSKPENINRCMEVQQYHIAYIKASKTIAGIKWQGQLYCRCFNEDRKLSQAIFYGLTPDSPERKDLVWASDNGTYETRSYVRMELFDRMVDLIRNEKPIKVCFNLRTKRVSLRTATPEPVGEEES
jgi:hypothetical protein